MIRLPHPGNPTGFRTISVCVNGLPSLQQHIAQLVKLASKTDMLPKLAAGAQVFMENQDNQQGLWLSRLSRMHRKLGWKFWQDVAGTDSDATTGSYTHTSAD